MWRDKAEALGFFTFLLVAVVMLPDTGVAMKKTFHYLLLLLSL